MVTKLFVVVEGNWQDYEGGGDAICSIWSTEELALADVKRLLKEKGVPKLKRRDGDGQWHLSGSPSNSWLEIQEWPLDDIPQGEE
jgi:hypothetical protein